jgi:3',5'-cyclic AMP phosphodiesterase CpdA
MRTVVHLSDLHFGRINEATIDPLLLRVGDLRPDVVVVSGDLTQRARTREFQEARRFLDSLPKPQIVVPGNHDVPAYNLVKRVLEPLRGYRRHITDDLLPSYIDDEVAVCGLNSTRSFTTKHGRLRERDVARVRATLMPLSASVTRIVACHHPFDLPARHARRDLIGNAEGAMRAFAECRVDVILSGHLHLGHTSRTAARYRIPGYSALIVQAGTAISSRSRGEVNSFNVLHLRGETLGVERLTWDAKAAGYALSTSEEFARTAEGWSPLTTNGTLPR